MPSNSFEVYSSQLIIVFHGVTVPEQLAIVKTTLLKSTLAESDVDHNCVVELKLMSRMETAPGTSSALMLR